MRSKSNPFAGCSRILQMFLASASFVWIGCVVSTACDLRELWLDANSSPDMSVAVRELPAPFGLYDVKL